MDLKIIVFSDGKYGDRTAEVVKKKFPRTKIIYLEKRNPSEFIDEYDLSDEIFESIDSADLLILYILHPDIVAELCDQGKPTIIPIEFGEGFLTQVRESNPKVVVPVAMCNYIPESGIKEIDHYFKQYGIPEFKIKLEKISDITYIIRDVKLITESPCGATKEALSQIIDKPLVPETLSAYALNVRHECREPVSLLLSRDNMAESSSLLHIQKLIDALEAEAPDLFLPDTIMGEYAKKRRKLYLCSGK